MGDATRSLQIDPNRSRGGPIPANACTEEAPDIATLTQKMVAGDEMAYRTFHLAYFDRLSRYLLVVAAGDEDVMRESLQEAFRRVVRHIRVFHDESVFWSWLTVLARTARSDEGRRRRRYLALLDRFRRQTPSTPAVPNDQGDCEDLEALLQRCMARLPDDERSLLEMKYFDHLSVAEIARRLQATEKAVESRLVRVRVRLKAAIVAELKNEQLG